MGCAREKSSEIQTIHRKCVSLKVVKEQVIISNQKQPESVVRLELDEVEFILRIYGRSRNVFLLGDRPSLLLAEPAPGFAGWLGRFGGRANGGYPGAATCPRSA